ncbi:IclR family transcriptional regulator [Paraburkholderia lycopersici]|uniref:DNA-binding transcriptional regulator, IclR family n=1 Tax=Paraburkholderia lycopersici TaxID=416944 RepID=A0A1G6TRN3_9BURK|nr:helix-turn-helix domain-containing protein [Paraburkholderia lycopersici]SDD31758.1 DNA-binding transcriptional regulator, IclR family [Paraburkholderia lycopersici]
MPSHTLDTGAISATSIHQMLACGLVCAGTPIDEVSISDETGRPRSGTQSLERAICLLRELASRNRAGWRLGELAARCEIDKGSAHRLLACLIRERLVEQRSSDRRYQLGPLLWELALSAPPRTAPPDVCRERLTAVARRFGGLAFLMLRSGNEYVCAMRAGHAELRAISVEAGTRRPLITSAGGVSILLALPEYDAQRIRANNIRQELSRCGDVRLRSLDQMYRRSQAFGYGVNLGDVVPGIHAVGVPVFSRPGKPVASLCLMTWSDSLPEARVDEACEALMAEAPAAVACCTAEVAA